MKKFLDENFLLESKTAEMLYHNFAKQMPVIDYHNHLIPDQMANDINFENITQAWLYGDHYKWRAMRANGIDEHYITGGASDLEKFKKWAETVPYTLRNPLYHWTHLELQRYFDVHEVLSAENAERIYHECTAKLQTPEYSVLNLLRKMNVKTLCTTDDPLDNLEFHQKLKNDGVDIKILPAFRPDKAMNADDTAGLNQYIDKLAALSGAEINDLDTYLSALKARHDYFAANGCSVSDHGLEQIYAEDYTAEEVKSIFVKIRTKAALSMDEVLKFKSALLFEFALWDHEKGWVQQYHLGALRNNNNRLLTQLGPDTGFDSIGDFSQAKQLSKFLNNLDSQNRLAKTILYNLNPADNELMATMIGNYNDGTVAGKVQWGSGWWFLDQKDGMIKQLNTLSNMGLLSRFVGMLTDSRSFLSYPRHEYFRRILCNLFGADVENGELPNDQEWLGKVIQDICYNNAKTYFNF
ncbi:MULTISPECIES: glucuronate isomerase [Pedobacter]|uniref:Uronate isomerase n=1 Tax=Pedobacter heparinus (strain ATCC 13125 / DSM 2366 / CIP 104194 / JCM 7457 / NBRC 12017 / NCIMB 9290 / NRRL B-14731 / HIM 762-3) TaxID=485917 RepID=C6Y3V1_PEDHD|nr:MULTISPECIES: glucuronate isomerase [Pedobacter]ACU03380.1 Glucuronate isomerase [Pedobacter heparinus DSM 2366]MBB5441149.1 glucuronate isomerase [Pedobacter sp. AK017]